MHLLNRILEKSYSATSFVFIFSILNFLFFYLPFLVYVFKNIDYKSINGALLVLSFVILALLLHAFVFYILYNVSPFLAKFFLIVFFILSSLAVYFINTYGVIIDESMIGNVINTNWEESSSFFSIKLALYILVFGLIPSFVIVKLKTQPRDTIIKIFKNISFTLLLIVMVIFINAKNILWVDKHSKYLGGLVMPWSYIVNVALFYKHKNESSQKEILLPNLSVVNKEKSVVVLVIGESARKANFSLFGYLKNTNPLLSNTDNLFLFDAESCATYTRAGVKCILSHTDSDKLYEILPNYLYRNGVDVIWRTTNWGEPPVHIQKFQNRVSLINKNKGEYSNYDEILLTDLSNEILNSPKDKILIVLHTSTSHGPSYSTKYPPHFELFKPVCTSVELNNCSKQSLINAYDNTIVYTDYLLAKVIECLKTLNQIKSTMIFVSDHGESLGEQNLYMHGIPKKIAPKEQFEIPFIVWVSDNKIKLKENKKLSQSHVFHSVLNFLSLQSPIYNENMNIFKPYS